MSDSWFNNQQWTAGSHPSGTPPMGQNNWQQQQQPGVPSNVGGAGWQGMQQAPPTNFYHQQFQSSSGPANQGQFQVHHQNQVPFQQPFQGQGQFQNSQGVQNVPQGFGPGQNLGYQGSPQLQQHRPHPPQMSPQQLRQQQQRVQEQRLKEEQRQRELEIQRRKMKNMDITKATVGNLDDLIGMATLKPSAGSPSRTRNKEGVTAAGSDDPLPTTPSGSEQLSSGDKALRSKLDDFKKMKNQGGGSKSVPESSKAHAWTSDSTGLEGLFAQHTQQPVSPSAPPLSQLGQSEDSFGDFQSGPTGMPDLRQVSCAKGEGREMEGFERPSEANPSSESVTSQSWGNNRNVLSRKVAHGPVSFTTGSQRPVLSTSISGLTNKGYISSDLIQSHPHGVLAGGAEGHTSPPPQDQSSQSQKFAILDTSKFPEVYTEVYRRSAEAGGGAVSTELVFPLLLSSHLQRSVLRDLWTVANRGVPGKLNQTELFVLLGLIALVQGGNPSPTLEDLRKAPQPPVPLLAALGPSSATSTQTLDYQSLSQSSKSSQSDSTRKEDFGVFQTGSAASSIPVQPVSVPPPGHATTLEPTQPAASSLSSMFPVPEYQPPPGDKYSAFEALDPVSEGIARADSRSKQESLPRTVGHPDKDKYAVLADLTTSSGGASLDPSKGGGIASAGSTSSTPMVPTPVQKASAPSKVMHVAGHKGGKNVVETRPGDDNFGSFLSGPSLLQPSIPSATDVTGGGKTESNGAPSEDTKKESKVPASDEFGSFTSGPTSFSAFPRSSSGTKDLGWANFGLFDSHQQQQHQEKATGSSNISTWLLPSTSQGVIASSQTPPLTSSALTTSSTSYSGISSLDDLSAFPSDSKTQTSISSSASFPEVLKADPHKSSPKSSKKTAKAASGLELLEEEFSSRILASNQSEVPPPRGAMLSPTLIPEPSGPGSATSLEKFGEFEGFAGGKGGDGLECASGSTTSFGKAPADPSKVWKSCLKKCVEVLHDCAEVFAESKDEEEGQNLLQEITSSEEGLNRLKGIVEVYKLSRRIHACVKENKSDDAEFRELVSSIKTQWGKLVKVLPGQVMEKLFQKSISSQKSNDQQDKTDNEEDFLSDTISRCSLCLMGKEIFISPPFSLSNSPEQYYVPLLFHNGKTYHASCGNFWTNVVQDVLPDLCD